MFLLFIVIIALFLIIDLPYASAEVLIDTDFGNATEPVLTIIDAEKDLQITGMLPTGWHDNSSWAKVNIEYQKMNEGDLEFLRINFKKRLEGWCQLSYQPLPEMREGDFYALSLKIRNRATSPVQVGIRMMGSPYEYIWDEIQNYSKDWGDYSFKFQIRSIKQPVGFYIAVAGEGTVDIASLKLLERTREELIADIKAEYKGVEFNNFLRVSRFPLGLQSGWSLDRDNSDTDDVIISPDANMIGPSGAPALHIKTDEYMRLYTAPFGLPMPVETHVASLYVRGNGKGRIVIVGDKRGLSEKSLELKPEESWRRVEIQFMPLLMAKAYGIRIEFQGEIWVDAMQVERGTESTIYKSQLPCEVALACTKGDAKSALVQFDDEPASVSYCVSGNANEASLKAKVVNLYGQEKLLPEISLNSDFLQYGEIEYNVFPEKPYGTFRVEAWVEDSSGKRISSYNEILINRLHRPRYWMKDAPNSHFGVHTNSTTRHILIAKAVGINWTRLHDAGLNYLGWYHIEPEKGQWKFRDKELYRYRRLGMKILGELGTAPKWASYYQDVGKDHSGYFDCFYQPKKLEDYENYVRVVTQRYKGVIDAYDVWNEPWIHAWWGIGYDESKGTERDGYITSQDPTGDFVKLMETACKTAKSVDENITILGVNSTTGGAGKNNFSGEEWTRGIVEHNGLDYCDVVCYHQYTGDPVGFPGDTVDMGFHSATKAIVEKFSKNIKPVWMSEGSSVAVIMGSGFYKYTLPYDISENIIHTSNRLCGFIVSLMAQGVEKVFLYSMHSHSYFPSGSNWSVLVTDEGALHPSGAAHSAMAWFLEDAKFAKTLTLAEGVYAYLFEGTDKSVAVLSAKSPYDKFQIPDGEGIHATDLFGNPLPSGTTLGDNLVYIWTHDKLQRIEELLKK